VSEEKESPCSTNPFLTLPSFFTLAPFAFEPLSVSSFPQTQPNITSQQYTSLQTARVHQHPVSVRPEIAKVSQKDWKGACKTCETAGPKESEKEREKSGRFVILSRTVRLQLC
jgi:hypothetical protein